jgi:hypothetical protein
METCRMFLTSELDGGWVVDLTLRHCNHGKDPMMLVWQEALCPKVCLENVEKIKRVLSLPGASVSNLYPRCTAVGSPNYSRYPGLYVFTLVLIFSFSHFPYLILPPTLSKCRVYLLTLVSNSGHFSASSVRVSNEWWIVKDKAGIECSVIKELSRHFPDGTEKYQEEPHQDSRWRCRYSNWAPSE